MINETAIGTHIMLDLETLSVRPGGVILSIGAVRMTHEWHRADRFYYGIIRKVDSLKYGFKISQETVDWWEKQSEEARQVLSDAENELKASPVKDQLVNFSEWCRTQAPEEEIRMWGNGAAMDLAMLREYYDELGMTPPWRFWNDRCFRTLKNEQEWDDETSEWPKELLGVAHNSLDDACHQARLCLEMKRQQKLPLR